MQKKSQVMIFVLVGLLVLVLFGLIFYGYSSKIKGLRETEVTSLSASKFADDPVVAYTKNCIDIVAVEAGYVIGLYGGYSKAVDDYYATQAQGSEYNVTIVLKNGRDELPSLNEIEQQIGEYIKDNLPKCVNNFRNFAGYQIEQGAISSKARILDDHYEVQVTYPLSIKIADSEIRVSDFDLVKVPIRLKRIHQVAKEIISKSISDPENIHLSYLFNLENDNFKVLYFPRREERKIVFMIHDLKSSVLQGSIILGSDDKNPQSNRQYIFVFGMDFSWYQKVPTSESSFAIINKLVSERNK